MNLTDEEILDFVRENLVIDKDQTGSYTLKEVLCPVIGDVHGYVLGHVRGNIYGEDLEEEELLDCYITSYIIPPETDAAGDVGPQIKGVS